MSGRRLTHAHVLSATLATALLAGGAWLGLKQLGLNQPGPNQLGLLQAGKTGHSAWPDLDPATGRTATRSAPPITTPEPTRPAEPQSRGTQRSSPSAELPSPTRAAKVTSSGSCGASFYHEPQGTASGEVFDPEALTAAHKTLPMHSLVRVTNPDNGKSVTVRINDRGPYIDGRCLDLSRAAFRAIADLNQGVLDVVRYEVLAQ